MEFRLEDLEKDEAKYIGESINGIVPHEVEKEEEEFVLKVENEDGEIIGGCIAEAYEYRWARLFVDDLWVKEDYRHQGIGSMIIREIERIAKEKGCRVITLGTASYMARPFYEKHGFEVFTTLKKANGHISYSLVKYLEKDVPEYVPTNNSGTKFKVSFGNDDDADVIDDGISAYSNLYEGKCEHVDFSKKLVDENGKFVAGVIADVEKGLNGFVIAIWVEEPFRHQGLGTYLLKEVDKFAKENAAPMVLTNAGDWNIGFFKKNGYLLRGELKDVPKGHDVYELYKNI